MRSLFILSEIVIIGIVVYFFNTHDGFVNFIDNNKPWATSLVYFGLFFTVVDVLVRIIKMGYSKRNDLPYSKKDNFHYGVENIAKLLIGLASIVTLFGLFGVNVKALLTSLSIFLGALTLIMREYINDFLVGIYFSFTKNFEIGDFVQVSNQKGRIQEIEMLKIKLMNENDDLVIIPNGKIYSSEIINYTKRDIRSMNIDFQLDITLIDNIDELEIELKGALAEFSDYINNDSYNLRIVKMGKDHIDFKFQYSLEKMDVPLQRKIRRKTVREVFNYISSKK